MRAWLLEGLAQHSGRHHGPHVLPEERHAGHPWWQVLCLTGVDYFSSIGYQPGIALLAVGAAAPWATLVLVGVTLLGALPVYRRVARESPRGEGSIAMLERVLSWWGGKLFVLVLLGFAATDFVITMTLSSADASQHLIENSFAPHIFHGHALLITLAFLALLAAVFLRGFREAIGVAVILVVVYLALNLVVVAAGVIRVVDTPGSLSGWWHALAAQHPSVLSVIGISLIGFPKLALGLSGFETGVLVMPQIEGGEGDEAARRERQIRGARRLLTVAAAIMAVLLLSSSLITAVLIPEHAYRAGGPANGRAMAYLAHGLLGNGFGSAYDLSTIMILWFAGASAMAGLLNLVPRYLPRYGMAPEWARAVRPLVFVIAGVAFIVTLAFNADVDSQAGAYATGVLVLITSAAIAVTLVARDRRQRRAVLAFGAIAAVFIYTTGVNIIERPEGVMIGAAFILVIVAVSLGSRVARSRELRVSSVTLDPTARELVREAARGGRLALVANDPDARDSEEYAHKAHNARAKHHLSDTEPLVFVEITVPDASEFESAVQVLGERRHGYRVLTATSSSVANTLAALALSLQRITAAPVDVYFDWSELSPIHNQIRFLVFGVGEVAPLTRDVICRAEPDIEQRPAVHVA